MIVYPFISNLTQPWSHILVSLFIHYHQRAYGFNSRHMATGSPFFLFVIQQVYPWLYLLVCIESFTPHHPPPTPRKRYRCTYRIMHIDYDVLQLLTITILHRCIHLHAIYHTKKLLFFISTWKMPQCFVCLDAFYYPLKLSLWGYHRSISFLLSIHHPS